MATRKRDVHYVDNAEFYAALVDYRKQCREAEKAGKPKPRVSSYIGSCIMKIAEKFSHRPNFIGYCVDDTTEALTKDGWKGYDSISINDEILSYDVEEKRLKWSEVVSVYRNGNYDGPMHRLTVKGLDALVTPGHRFVTDSGLKKVELLGGDDHIVLNGDPVEGGPGTFPDEFVELTGWAVTEGHYSVRDRKRVRQQYVAISQNVGPKADRIRNCLVSLDAHFKEYEREARNGGNHRSVTFVVSRRVGAMLHQVSPGRVPSMDFLLSLTTYQRRLLLTTMVDGDGHVTAKGTMLYSQKDDAHVDSFLALAAMNGETTFRSRRTWHTPFGISEGNHVNVYASPKKTCYIQNIDLHGGRPGPGGDSSLGKEAKPNRPSQTYKGRVWCPETRYGTFVCRRGPYVYVTGNSYRDEMVADAIDNCIAYGVEKFDPEKSNKPFSYFTQITFNAFRLRIQKEKKQQYIKYKSLEVASTNGDLVEHAAYEENSGGGGTSKTNDGNAIRSFVENAQRFVGTYEESMENRKQKRKGGLEAFIDTDGTPSVIPTEKKRRFGKKKSVP